MMMSPTQDSPGSRTAPEQLALADALRTLETLAAQAASPREHCVTHTEVALCLLARTQDAAQAEWHLQQALHWARKGGDVPAALDLLCRLGAVAYQIAHQHERLGDHGRSRISLNRARDCCFEAVQALHGMHDRQAEAVFLARIAEVLSDCGDGEDAQALRERAQRLLLSPAEAARTLDACPVVSAFGALG